MAKRKISGIIKASESPMTIDTPWNQPQGDGTYHAYDGDDVEALLKREIKSRAKGVTVNGREAPRDAEGNVQVNVDVVNVDASLDATSTNAVSNQAATRAINDIDANMGVGLDIEDNDDGKTVKLSLLNKQNRAISSVDIPKGGDEDVSISRISIRAAVDHAQVKEGDKVRLTFTYDHVDGTGASDGVKGNIEVIINRGATQTFYQQYSSVDAGTTMTLDITDSLMAGTCEIYVRVSCVTADGTPQTRQAYTSVNVITLNLTSSFNIAASLLNGGYNNETIEVPFTITGSGDKVVTLYLDGVQALTKTITRSGTTNETFTLSSAGLSAGRHNFQIVAERDGLLSDSIYMDFLVAGSTVPFIGTKLTFTDGRIYTSDLTPTIEAAQYEQMSLTYAAWNRESVTSDVEVYQGNTLLSSVSVNRAVQTYQNRFNNYGVVELAFVNGETRYPFNVDVQNSAIDISEITSNLQLKLSASGRSNGEANPADWGGITEFFNFDWNTSGWMGDALRLRNGAKAVIGYKPFETDAKASGLTVEMEFKLSNVMDRAANVISCMDGGKGFNITAEAAQFYTGNTKTVVDSDGVEHERPVGVDMNFAPDLLLKVAFVLHTNASNKLGDLRGNSLMELYINGVRSKVDQYGSGDFFMQATPQNITIDSEFADVEVRVLRVYNRALTEEELLTNYIVDRPTGEEMLGLYTDNDVLGEDGNISLDKLRAKNRAVCVIIPTSQVDAANAENNKKTDFTAAKVYWYSPDGEQYDFVAENIYFRIQGTSSTKYPRKNYRLYLDKGPDSAANTRLTVGGQLQSSRKYALRPGGVKMKLFCLKADYSDSSLSMNTGGAKLFNTVTQELDLLTPPQQYQKDNNLPITVRQAVDGIPCDLFVASEDGGEMTYYGQYNMNNEKSKSEDLFGMKAFDDFNPTCPIALEALNNSNPFCLFQSAGAATGTTSQNLEDQLMASFDSGFEFNYPEDTFYNSASIKDAAKQSVATAAQKTAIKTLFGWIYECIPSNLRSRLSDTSIYEDISLWDSAKFRSEAANHFNVQHLLTYYLFTDYWVSVDQRAKNILWRTWDGVKWYATYYDGDTAQGMRNDSFLAYLYNTTRDTWDDEAAKYAFEGHDSVLWCLVLANLETELKTAANNLRNKLTTERMLDMFNGEQMHNWCERQYNQSGRFKYISPQIVGVRQKKDGVVQDVYYNYLYALTGNREAHRTAFLTDRGNLLDARYATNTYQSDRITMYASRTEAQAAQTVSILSGDLYYFGYRTNNGVFIDGPKQAEKGATVDLSFTGAMALNDPLNLCGASRIVALDWRRGPSLGGNFELNACRMLRNINLSNELGAQMQTSLKVLGLATCPQIETVDITGQNGISTGSATAFDLSAQLKLTSFKGGNTGLTSVTFAEGCPLRTAVLPSSLTTLRLRYLPKLTESGLTIQGYNNIERFEFAQCPNLNWQTLLTRCPNARYIRVEGIRGKIELSALRQYQNLGGVDADGNVVTTCRLSGEVTLTQFVSDSVLEEVRSHFPELTINNAQYTDYVEYDDEIDSKNIFNTDNGTGYHVEDPNADNDWEASGHIVEIRRRSVPVKGLYNETTKKMTLTKLSDDSYLRYANGGTFDPTDGIGEGFDVFMYIPKFFYKGINDYKNQAKHTLLSSRTTAPKDTWARKNEATLSQCLFSDRKGVVYANVTVGQPFNENTALSTYQSLAVYRIEVTEMKQVRYPSYNDAVLASVFVDEEGTVIQKDTLNIVPQGGDTGQHDYVNGDYIFRDVPSGAKWLYFTTLRTLSDDGHPVFAVDTDDIEAIEPGWVEHRSELIGVYGASIEQDTDAHILRIRSLSGKRTRTGTGTSTTYEFWRYDTKGNPRELPERIASGEDSLNYTYQDFLNLCALRGEGFHDVSYEQNKIIAILSRCWCGDRDDQAVYGMGNGTQYTTGSRDSIGKRDTTSGLNKIWGLEGWVACNWEVMDNVSVNISTFAEWKRAGRPATGAVNGVWHIFDPVTETERTVQGVQVSDYCIARLRHGKHCDIIASSLNSDNSRWNYCYAAINYYTASGGRVVGRAHSHADAGGGCVSAHAYDASSHSHVNYGARLAFSGEFENENDITA